MKQCQKQATIKHTPRQAHTITGFLNPAAVAAASLHVNAGSDSGHGSDSDGDGDGEEKRVADTGDPRPETKEAMLTH